MSKKPPPPPMPPPPPPPPPPLMRASQQHRSLSSSLSLDNNSTSPKKRQLSTKEQEILSLQRSLSSKIRDKKSNNDVYEKDHRHHNHSDTTMNYQNTQNTAATERTISFNPMARPQKRQRQKQTSLLKFISYTETDSSSSSPVLSSTEVIDLSSPAPAQKRSRNHSSTSSETSLIQQSVEATTTTAKASLQKSKQKQPVRQHLRPKTLSKTSLQHSVKAATTTAVGGTDTPKSKQTKPVKQHLRPNRRGNAEHEIAVAKTTSAVAAVAASKARLGIKASPPTKVNTAANSGAFTTSFDNKNNSTKVGGSLLSSILSKPKGMMKNSTTKSSSSYQQFKNNKSNNNHDDDFNNYHLPPEQKSILKVEDFFDNIREWDFIKDFDTEHNKQHQPHHVPKNKDKNDFNTRNTKKQQRCKEESSATTIKPIPNDFRNLKHYQKIWKPLCFKETRAQFMSDAITQWRGGGGNNCGSTLIPIIATIHTNDVLYDTLPHRVPKTVTLVTHTIQQQQQQGEGGRGKRAHHSESSSGNNNNNRIKNEQHQQRLDFCANDFVVLVREEYIFTLASRGELQKKIRQQNQQQQLYDDDHSTTSSIDPMEIVNRKAKEDKECNNGSNSSSEIYSLVGNVEYFRRTCDGLKIQVSRHHWNKMIHNSNTIFQSSNSTSVGGGSGSGRVGAREERFYLWKLGANVTSLREYTALCNAGSLTLLPYLLSVAQKKAMNPETSKTKTKTKGAKEEDDNEVALKEGIDKDKTKNKTTSTNNLTKKDDNKKGGGEAKLHDYEDTIEQKRKILKKFGGTAGAAKGFIDYALNKFNSSQLGAISAASTEYGKGGITLVKGPPGTGKTTTLVALLNALHIRQFNQYFEKVRQIATAGDTYSTSNGAKKKIAIANAARKHKPRLLVCAPSNNAVDHILRTVMQDGFIDGNGFRYNPSVVRVGVGQSATVKDVSLQSKVNELIDEARDGMKLEQAIAGYRVELSRIHSDIKKLRIRIKVMEDACPWPLSRNWEIRTTEDDNVKAFFVNHKEKMTTFECPPPPEPDETQYHVDAMPEHRSLISQLVKLIERYNSCQTKLERYSIVDRISSVKLSSNAGGKINLNQLIDSVRQQLETHILDNNHIVMTTLGTAGSQSLKNTSKFEVVVVDEAAQSVEPATLVAFQLGSSHAILVGDPQQLPATIFSGGSGNTKYDRSLFQRLEEAGHEVHLLNIQYRMNPLISNFPRRIFYGGYLKDGPNVKHKEYGNPLREIIRSQFPAFNPFTVFDLDSREERGITSLSNTTEANFALHLYESLSVKTKNIINQTRVAIITPYSQQMNLLKRTFAYKLGPNYEKFVEVNTVDAYQGRESNIVIISCVRASAEKGSIGFLSDVRRMNVALTRAKFFLFVITRCDSIIVNPYWRELVDHARNANSVIPVAVRGERRGGGRQNTATFPDLRTVKASLPKGAALSKKAHKKSLQPSLKKRKILDIENEIKEEGEIM